MWSEAMAEAGVSQMLLLPYRRGSGLSNYSQPELWTTRWHGLCGYVYVSLCVSVHMSAAA